MFWIDLPAGFCLLLLVILLIDFLLGKIVDSRLPTLEQVIQYCKEQMGKESRPPIGFRRLC